MLSDWERTSLADLEQALRMDPKLVRRFDRAARTARVGGSQGPGVRCDWLLALAIGLALAFGALALLFGNLGVAALSAVVAGSVAVVRHWLHLSKRVTG
jgi:Flp pilus assembly protein TadB